MNNKEEQFLIKEPRPPHNKEGWWYPLERAPEVGATIVFQSDELWTFTRFESGKWYGTVRKVRSHEQE